MRAVLIVNPNATSTTPAGRDLLAMGVPPGPRVGLLLGEVRRLQLDGDLSDPDVARAWLAARLAEVG